MTGRFTDRPRIVAVAATALLVITGLTVTGAFAGKRLKTKTQSTTISPPTGGGTIDEESLTPQCKKKQKAISGGWFGELEVDSSGIADGGVVVPSVNRREGRRSWTGTAVNLGPENGDYEVYAYCRKQKKVKSSTDEVAAPGRVGGTFTRVRATATCPPGTKIVSGGFEAPTDLTQPDQALVLVTESRRLGKREWTVAGANIVEEDTELTAQANCSKRKLKERTGDETTFPTATGETATLEAKCKQSQRVISGGYESPDFASGELAIVNSSRKQGKRTWVVEAFGQGTTLTAYAYCEKKKKKK